MPEVIFNGPAGRIEARYHHSKAPGSPIAILLHPHPTFGGTIMTGVRLYESLTKDYLD